MTILKHFRPTKIAKLTCQTLELVALGLCLKLMLNSYKKFLNAEVTIYFNNVVWVAMPSFMQNIFNKADSLKIL